jgi:lysozyme
MNPYIEDQLIRDEGLRLKVYDDATGKPLEQGDTLKGHPTIGIGRNLAGLGLTEREAYYLLGNDIARVTAECRRIYPWFDGLDDLRQSVVLNMRFNLGSRLDQFHMTLAAIARGDYSTAAAQMRKSLWARQVGPRAERLARIMEGE